jgi:hypothetical protein
MRTQTTTFPPSFDDFITTVLATSMSHEQNMHHHLTQGGTLMGHMPSESSIPSEDLAPIKPDGHTRYFSLGLGDGCALGQYPRLRLDVSCDCTYPIVFTIFTCKNPAHATEADVRTQMAKLLQGHHCHAEAILSSHLAQSRGGMSQILLH